MAYLEEYEWMFLNEIAYNISFIYSFDDMREKTVNWIRQLMGFDGASFSLVIDNEIRDTYLYNIDDKYKKVYQKYYKNDNPLSWILESGRNTSYIESEMISKEALEKSRIYREFYKPNHFVSSMGTNIVFRQEVVGLVNFYKTSGDFSKREMFIIDQLQKHFAYRISYEAKKGDTRYFYAKGFHDRLCKEYNLTRRESELLDYAVKGYTNEIIAEKMQISTSTVKKHFHSLYGKMNVTNRVQLIQCLPLSTDKINYEEL